MSHSCHAKGCRVEVAPRLLMCPRHWSMVPAHLQRAVYAHYRAGQELDKRPSRRWHEAADAAIAAVARREASGGGRQPCHRCDEEPWGKRCRTCRKLFCLSCYHGHACDGEIDAPLFAGLDPEDMDPA